MMAGALCVITARGGSKRIPRKNVRDFCGKPIIAYSIEAALGSGLFDEVMVSTDDREIAMVAREYGAEVPFMRSAATSDDFATTSDVLLEVLGEYDARGRTFDVLCCLYPTAPFVTGDDLRSARRLMASASAPAVCAVCEFDFPPQRGFIIDEHGAVRYAHPEYALVRSQDLPRMVHDCGSFYIIRVDAFCENGTLIAPGCLGYVMEPQRVQDIDAVNDWTQAEMKYRMMSQIEVML